MKLTHFLAAGLMLAGVGVSTEASAQRYDYNRDHRGDRDGRHDWDRRDDHRWDRHDRDDDWRRHQRWGRHDNGNHYGWRNGNHRGWGNHGRNCRIEWRHHQRVRVCY